MKRTPISWPRGGRHCTGTRAQSRSQLTDRQRLLIANLLPHLPPGGRPRAPPRPWSEGILLSANDAARWKLLPRHFGVGSGNAAHRSCSKQPGPAWASSTGGTLSTGRKPKPTERFQRRKTTPRSDQERQLAPR